MSLALESLVFESDDTFEPESGIVVLPEDLESDEPEMESTLHLVQLLVLFQSLELFWRDRNDFFAAGNMTVFFSPRQLKTEHFRGPDFFVVLDTERRPRKSWAVWAEGGKYPNFIVEILSSRTKARDRGIKKQVYQDIFRTPDYFWFDPDTLEFAGFHLIDGRYEPLQPDAAGRLWSAQLGLSLGLHEDKLRFFTAEGELLPGGEELAARAESAKQQAESAKQQAESAKQQAESAEQQAESAKQQAESAKQQAESAKQRAALLAQKLRELGVDPDALK